MSEVETELEAEVEKTPVYDYDDAFQLALTAFVMRSTEFNQRSEGLVRPEYMASKPNALLVKIALDYYEKYRFCPSRTIWPSLLKDAANSKLIRKDDVPDVVARYRECWDVDLVDNEYVLDGVSSFAKRQALEAAIFEAAAMIDKGKFDQVESVIQKAMMVGLNEEENRVKFFELAESRAEYRKQVVAGTIKPDGITTGHKEIDKLLHNRGWGRKELSVLMGPAKSGKSMNLISFAILACLAGHNVVYVTLEVASRIVADRADANISNVSMSELDMNIGVVKSRVSSVSASAGEFDIFDYPSGSFSPQDLRRLLSKAKAKGRNYDLIVVDYADLMRPDFQSQETRENSRQIYVGLRGVAHEFNAAVLSATQTNREGFKAAVGKMEHVAEDINKARTVDLLLSINATEDERARGESRIYFAASRNQKSDITLRVKTDLSKARAIEKILSVE